MDAKFNMKLRFKFSILGNICLGVLLSLAVNAAAEQSSSVTIPKPPKAKSNTECVAAPNDIRRNHGDYLKHHRDQTMHHGIRTTKYSLVACINCHVTADSNGNYPDIKDGSKHFCRSCHNYAAVSIDCFQCHATKPETP
jgi:hypothetical protein